MSAICPQCKLLRPQPGTFYGYAGPMCKCGFIPTPRTDVAYSVTAQRIYEAYAAYGPLFSGLPMAWDNLGPEIQAAWIAAAKAI